MKPSPGLSWLFSGRWGRTLKFDPFYGMIRKQLESLFLSLRIEGGDEAALMTKVSLP